MIEGFAGATIWSEHLQRLLPFYRDTIGLKVDFESPEFVVLSQDGRTSLNLGTHSEVKGKAADPYRHMVGLATTDLDADYQRLSSSGVEFIETPTAYDVFRIATLKDPDGNLVQLFQRVG